MTMIRDEVDDLNKRFSSAIVDQQRLKKVHQLTSEFSEIYQNLENTILDQTNMFYHKLNGLLTEEEFEQVFGVPRDIWLQRIHTPE